MNITSLVFRHGFSQKLAAFIKYPSKKTYSDIAVLWSKEHKWNMRNVINKGLPVVLCPEKLSQAEWDWNGTTCLAIGMCQTCPLYRNASSNGKTRWGRTWITSKNVCLVEQFKSARKLSEKTILAVQIEAALEQNASIVSELDESRSGLYNYVSKKRR